MEEIDDAIDLMATDPALSSGAFNEPEAAPSLSSEVFIARLLKSMHLWHSRTAAAECLIRLGSSAVPGLLMALYDQNPSVRLASIRALRDIGDLQAVDGLIGALYDEHQLVRREAAVTLAHLGDKRAIPELVRLLSDDEIWVRRDAVIALGKIGDPDTVPYLLAMFEDALAVRYAAERSLRSIGAAGIQPLFEALHDERHALREAAIRVLVRIGEEMGRCQAQKVLLPRLKSLSESSPYPMNRAATRVMLALRAA